MKTLDCGGCGATLDVEALAPGTTFSCGACGASLTVPAAAPAAAPPAAPPRKAPTRATAPAPAPAAKAAPSPAKAPRAARGGGEAPSRPSRRPAAAGADGGKGRSKGPLVGGIVAGVVIVAGGIALALKGGGKEPAPVENRPALGPATASKPADPPAPEKTLTPEEIAWNAASTEAARNAFVEERLAAASAGDEPAKALFSFLAGRSRSDLARKVAAARADAEPGSPWANGVLGRTDMGEALRAVANDKEAASLSSEAGKRILDRVQAGRTWVDAADRSAVEADLAAAREELKRLSDPWWKEAMEVLAAVKGDASFQRYSPVEHIAWPPYLVMAQVQDDETRHSTKNVLDNHSKFFQCLTGEFLRVMEEAGLPRATLADLGNPVLKAFVFRSRSSFDNWHRDQRWPKDALKGVRAYYAWGGSRFMMMYDTGAPTTTQDEDTCTAFHEATHQLVHYYRRYYLTLEDRKTNPAAPEVDLGDDRLHGETHWFQEGFAEFFGAADRISSQTGEWKLFRPYKSRMYEWGDPILRKTPQWTLEEVLQMKNKMIMAVMAEKKWPGHKEEMNSLFYAQAWALNHLLYFGKDGSYRERYLRYVNEEMRSRGGYERFMECMGVGPGKEEREAFLEELGDDWRGWQKLLLKRDSGGGR